jgi:hypothetical protein
MKIDVVNTVNTSLDSQYDFGIHAAGCADVQRAATRHGAETYCGIEAESPAAYIASDEADFAAQDQHGFTYRVFPCCKKEQSSPPQWDEIVTCRLCGHTSRAQWKRTGYRPGWWLCLSRKACNRRQMKQLTRRTTERTPS